MAGLLAPWALLGLLALPALLALYLLRRRGREVTVPALFLWRALAAPAAGARLAPRRLPLPFWLELAALALLALAAAGPWQLARGSRPLLVVLDPSYSLQAGGDASPRARAQDALLALLASAPDLRPTLLLASDPPALLGEGLGLPEARRALAGWTVEAPAASLDAALRWAAERRAPRVLVLTDGPPPAELPPAVTWWAFGQPRANLAIVSATRASLPSTSAAAAVPGGESEGVVLEVANLGADPAAARLTLRAGGGSRSERRTLAAGESWRVRLPAPRATTVEAQLAPDDLAVDDAVVLPGRAQGPVTVAIGALPARFARLAGEAVVASGLGTLVPAGAGVPALEVRAAEGAAAEAPADGRWRLLVHREEPATAYLGPFAVDARHALAAGLAVEGVVWSAGGAAANPPGHAVLAAGDVVLLADVEREDGGHDLHLRLRDELSTLERSPAWPVLWWNLLVWRREAEPGPRAASVRLGEVVEVLLPPPGERAAASGPGWRASLLGSAGAVRFLPPRPGLYRVTAGATSFEVGVGTLQRGESDLRDRASGRWGEIDDAAPPGRQPLGWAAAALALALLALEAAVLAGRRGAEAAAP
jgi:hypothetical protein